MIAISGMLSSFASAMAVTRLVAPGPLVAMTTPTLPVERAIPCEANAPPCSCRGKIVLSFPSYFVSDWCMGIEHPPG